MKKSSKRLRILVADIAAGQLAIQRALDEKFELIGTNNFTEAKLLLQKSLDDEQQNKFHLVICGMHFDDCKMFDLLHHVMDEPELSGLPFLVIQAKRSQIPFDSAGTLAGMLGALEMLDLQDLSVEETDKLIRSTIDRLFAMQT